MITLAILFILGAIICWWIRFVNAPLKQKSMFDMNEGTPFDHVTLLLTVLGIGSAVILCIFFLP